MVFEVNEIVRVKSGPDDEGHGNKEGLVIEIETDPVVLIADYPISMKAEKVAYKVVFPPTRL